SLYHPVEGRFQSLRSRDLRLGSGDPLDVFLSLAVGESRESGQGLFVFLQAGRQVVRNHQFLSWRLSLARQLCSGLVQADGFDDAAGNGLPARQICDGCNSPQVPHRLTFLDAWDALENQSSLPESKG